MPVITKPKTDPRKLMLQIQAERELDATGPTTLHKVLGDQGHVRVLARQLLDNERAFRVAIARWYKTLGKAIIAALRADQSGSPLQAVRDAVTDEHRDDLRIIVEEHVRRAALLSAAIEWEMHQTRPNTKEVLRYVQKGIWDFVKSLPKKVITAVKLVVAATMAVFVPDSVITPIIDRVERAVTEATTAAPPAPPAAPTAPTPAEIADAVNADVFNRARVETVAAGVAVTQNTEAANAGASVAGQVLGEMGIVNAKKFMTLHGTGALDARVRPSHRKANGQIVGINESFTLEIGDGKGTETCDYPGDSSLSAGNRMHCRCLSIYLWDPKIGAS